MLLVLYKKCPTKCSLSTHLTIDEREQIFLLHHQGDSVRMIAKALKRSPSTISRELARNTDKESYSPTIAQTKYTKIKSNCGRKLLLENAQLKTLIKKLFLNEQWSPEQIATRLKLVKSAHMISFNTIYRAIYRGDFYEKNLSQGHRGAIRKLRHKGKTGKACLVTLTDCKSRYLTAWKIEKKLSTFVRDSMVGLLSSV